MHYTNGRVKKYLIEHGWTNIYLCPHLRGQKDYHIEECGFDGFALKNGKVYFFQIKTNMKISKKELARYIEIEKNYDLKCLWLNRAKRKIFCYNTDYVFGLKFK